MVMEVMHGDTAACANHPFRNTTTPDRGGICAFCLREKLRNLISSSFPEAVFPSASSSSSPSRSDVFVPESRSSSRYMDTSGKRPPCVASHNHHKRMMNTGIKVSDSTGIRSTQHVLDGDGTSDSPCRKGFWSFLHYRQKKASGLHKDLNFTTRIVKKGSENKGDVDEEHNDDEASASPDPKISRSRSMGCGSRNLSGDIFDRLSTGFGEWSLRRVASQKEAKRQPKVPNELYENGSSSGNGLEGINERVVHGGILSGFIMTSSSSSSSSSSYRVASSLQGSRKSASSSMGKTTSHSYSHSHSRSRSWGWVFASPMRGSGRPPSGRKGASSSKSSTPSLSAIPPLYFATPS